MTGGFLKCPVCGDSLTVSVPQKRAFCPRGHSFDRAAEGYFNLVTRPSQSSSGDPAETVAARRAFFSHPAGYYEPLATTLCSIIDSLPVSGIAAAADACCGEGYFTRRIMARVRKKSPEAACYAFDLSKKAVKIASKADPETQYFTANVSHIPLETGSVGLLTHIFAPVAAEEFYRVLSSDGYIIRVFPGKKHLWQIKCALYENPYENDEDPSMPSDFRLVDFKKVSTEAELDNQSLRNLLLMTPYSFRTKKEALERLLLCPGMLVNLEFVVNVYKKG